MTTERAVKGSCLCGGVTFNAALPSQSLGACHCSSCRKWGGGPLLTVESDNAVAFSGAEWITVFPSSEWAERGFCRQCGSHLFYRLRESGQYILPVGLLNNLPELKFDHQVFIDHKPDYYDFSNKTECLTGEELFARYAEGA